MATEIKVPRDCKVGIGAALQSVLGTGIADNAAVTELNCKLFEFKPGVNFGESDSAHGSREQIYADIAVSGGLALPKTSIVGDINLNDFHFFGALFFQSVTEAGTTPFGKVMSRHATQPDFSSNAGYFATLFERDAVYPRKTIDVISNSLKITWKGTPGARAQFECGVIGRGNPAACTPSGTWTPSSTTGTGSASSVVPFVDRFDLFTLNFGSGNQYPILDEATFDLKRNVTGKGSANGANYQTLCLGNITGDATFKILKDSCHGMGLTNLPIGTPVVGRLGKGNATAGSVVGDFDIVFRGLITDVDTDYGESLDTVLKVKLLGADASTPGCVLTMANAIDAGW